VVLASALPAVALAAADNTACFCGNCSSRESKEPKKLAVFFFFYSQKPKDLFFAVAAVAAGVNANGGKFSSFSPAFDG